ncbi:hypothetical protein [Bradyrhizobium betae]|uniref:hypothetical protein n=1 Tax=Bradyrhizobium betae TaxID=244734 RepID=UPI00100E8567|nr:hypothetical protein [Bradyrhizobium betae]
MHISRTKTAFPQAPYAEGVHDEGSIPFAHSKFNNTDKLAFNHAPITELAADRRLGKLKSVEKRRSPRQRA